MKFKVIVFPGSNCDHDCYHVLKHVLGQDVEFLWHKNTEIGECDCVVLPGGFSYGDYLRSGAIASLSPIMSDVVRFANTGGLVLGICNGFQVLLEAKLLPGVLQRNESLHFICQDTFLKVENTSTPFTWLYNKKRPVNIPIAHMDGNYYVGEETLKEMEENEQIIFRYSTSQGKVTKSPNGSIDSIAGVCNKGKNVLGLMPHPERCAEDILGNTDGYYLFRSIVSWLERKREEGE